MRSEEDIKKMVSELLAQAELVREDNPTANKRLLECVRALVWVLDENKPPLTMSDKELEILECFW